jgi:hypothetical protein
LKISDYNTSGLTGSNTDRQSNWYSLVKSTGVTNKPDQSGGSYGIGKNAPFACSQFRTVFYGTCTAKEEPKFQGVAKLVTHLNNDDEPTRGTGYYGLKERNQPLIGFDAVDSFFYRDKVGTDIFIAGFNEIENWKESIIKSIIENFFVAIETKKISVVVMDVLINYATLPALIGEYISEDKKLWAGKYHAALTAPEEHYVEEDFKSLGKVELFLLTGDDYPKRVAMVRATGMKIFDKEFRVIPEKFAGVMIAHGEELNKLLRKLEPPSHNRWEADLYKKDRAYAKSVLNGLYSWIRERVRELSHPEDSDDLDVEGISRYLPYDLYEDELMQSKQNTEGEKSVPQQVEIEIRKSNYEMHDYFVMKEVATGSEGDMEGRSPHYGEDQNDDTNQHALLPDSVGGGGDESRTPGQGDFRGPNRTPPRLKKVRAFCKDVSSGLYTISFIPACDADGYLNVSIVGETGQDPLVVNEAIDRDTGENIAIHNSGKIGPIQFEENVRRVIDIKIDENYRYALEVTTSEN